MKGTASALLAVARDHRMCYAITVGHVSITCTIQHIAQNHKSMISSKSVKILVRGVSASNKMKNNKE